MGSCFGLLKGPKVLSMLRDSGTRSGFLTYPSFKDSVFTAIIFPFLVLFLFFLGEYISINSPSQYYLLSEKLVAALIVIGAECGAETISS